MGYGSNGTILRVDLTRGTTAVETFDEAFYRRYPGGKALAAYHLLREMPAGADPLGPDNPLILATGLLTGAPSRRPPASTPSPGRPLTGGFGESEAGGYWGPELKMAGLDAIILTGRSPEPVYLWVKDGVAEIRDARALWGQDPPTVQAAIKEAVGERSARVLQIGRAGENLVPYAMLMNELRHYNGRTGMGAVMGSKNVRAIAVKGSRKYLELAHDAAALGEIGKRLSKGVTEHPQSWDLRTKGTPGLTDGLNAGGILPTRNFRQGSFEQVEGIGFAAYEAIRSGTRTCYACAVRCKPETAFAGRYTVTDTYDGPEYEGIAGFGSNCAIFDLQLVARANELCNELGLDVISTAGTVAFVMECVEHGLLGPADLRGVDLRFGNGEALLEAIPLIAEREGIGELLALGSRRIAEQVGGEAISFAMQVKGLEMAMHEPRGKVGVAFGYATNEAGADHLVGFHDGVFVNPESVSFKGAAEDRDHRAGRARSISARRRSATGTPGSAGTAPRRCWASASSAPPRARSSRSTTWWAPCAPRPAGTSRWTSSSTWASGRSTWPGCSTSARASRAGRRPPADAPPRAARGRTAHGDVDRPGCLRGGHHPALRAEGLGSGDRRADGGAAARPRPRLGRAGARRVPGAGDPGTSREGPPLG